MSLNRLSGPWRKDSARLAASYGLVVPGDGGFLQASKKRVLITAKVAAAAPTATVV